MVGRKEKEKEEEQKQKEDGKEEEERKGIKTKTIPAGFSVMWGRINL